MACSCTVVSAIDAAAFFHQFLIDKDSRKFFAFGGESLGRCQVTRLPQGSSVAPAIASAYLELVLRPGSDIAISYVDNIIIRTTDKNPKQHLRDLKRVLDALAHAEITLNLKSSVWAGTASVPVLGIEWSRGHTNKGEAHI